MIGIASGSMVSTEELQEMASENANLAVRVDHERFEVVQVVFYAGATNHAKVFLEPQYGREDWTLEVSQEDYAQPMWEIA
jgi:hypothetical protein